MYVGASEKKILIVDDEPDIVKMLKYNLEKAGCSTITARDGIEALSMAKEHPDLIILDIMLPQLDGWEVARRLKRDAATSDIPIVFLTAKVSEVEEVVGFELGAADYVKKPFSLESLLARVRSILRRGDIDAGPESGRPERIRLKGMEIDTGSFSVMVEGSEIVFVKKEFELLLCLVRHRGTVLSREAILHAVWGDASNVLGRTVDVHIQKIREKLGPAACTIVTVKGVGYKFIDILHHGHTTIATE